MKNILCFLLSFVVILCAFGGCASEKPTINNSPDTDQEIQTQDNANGDSDKLENREAVVTLSESVPYDIIVFGGYEQDNDVSNGLEDIEWLVLEKTENSALLITDKIIDIKKFNEETNNDFINGTNPDWSSSDIREWLNNDFYSIAFSVEEQNKILTTNISTPNNPEFGTSGGPNTEDKVFLISSQDAEKYLDGTSHLHAEVTDTALDIFNGYGSAGIIERGTGWWLRTRGEIVTPPGCGTSTHIVQVSNNEQNGIYYSGLGSWYYMGVRPAIYVKY